MGTTGKWICLDCKHEFKGKEGGGFYFSLFRCVECDRTKSVWSVTSDVEITFPGQWVTKDPKGAGSCKWCGGELKDDIIPMCRKCRSRNTEQIEIEIFYD